MTKQRKIMLTLTILYTVIILYFMFFAFGRTGASERADGYTFIFLPDNFFTLPTISDLLHPTLMDIVDFGNTIAFIPFGILIPLLYRITFVRFLTLFFLSIIVLETVQALSFLGSFDINDAIQNSLGAAVGFGAYKLGFRSKNGWRNIIITAISSVFLLAGLWGLCGIVDKALTKEEGPFVAINELMDNSGILSAGIKPNRFTLSGQDVIPRYNMYDVGNEHLKTFTYASKEEMIFFLNYGMPEQTDYAGSIRVSVNGREVLTSSGEDQRLYPELFPAMFKIPVEAGSEIRITVEGNEKIWDVGYRKMKYFWN
ncbi:Glycopeptide antibiotics resistance protein [Paenibacillus sp. UNCCL117]|uniref:VanZ family protein n=1 Tax=unclassified Paenibacillus TaxID=185978 RepID=UPI00088FD504|nr:MULTISPECIES: VanZ family protein [unclassified Paenibacillus]SDE14290.1 Glycopeptide antibiotics resistance protein [Paenibacillus sp. cl123]SFW60556.1 Glycopeptide antibiotics resistance protein [Paenibacillus sp. UNCCL117]